ncbi:MAG: 6-bladed beta-propeller [Prevotellaceae bacterium]|jgi:hypothetical protein|nr:6-bladed beta-propeller [Prevotellaceae bacterium]
MRKYIILIWAFLFIDCVNRQNENSRYTEEQIASLRLDSTSILKTETDSVITINLNPFLKKQDFDFGSLVKEIKLVPLETTDESLVAPVYKVLVTDSHIYIYDKFKGGGLIIFNSEGKFIRRISNGRGPGELSRLYDIAYDWENNELVAYQHSFLLFFTPSGEFIRYMRLPFGFYNFTVIPDGYVFKAIDGQGNEHLDKLEYFTLFITDKNFKLKSAALPLFPMGSVLGGYNYLYNNNSTIHVTQKYQDTIYRYVDSTNKLKAKYILNYNKKKLPERYLKSATWDDFENVITQNDYYFYIGEYFETESHDIFSLSNWHTGKLTVYRDKKSNNLTGGTNLVFNPNEIPPLPPNTASGDYFISVHYPDPIDSLLVNSSIISDDDKRKIKNIKEDDNPVLVFFKLKDF